MMGTSMMHLQRCWVRTIKDFLDTHTYIYPCKYIDSNIVNNKNLWFCWFGKKTSKIVGGNQPLSIPCSELS